MNPFVFKNRVKGIIVSYKCSVEFLKLVEDLKIEIIKTDKIKVLDDRIDDHPDMAVHFIDYNNIIVYKDCYDYYVKKLKNYNINILPSNNNLGKTYPNDIYLNISRSGKYYFYKKNYIDEVVNKYLDIDNIGIDVKQGYSKCSSMIIKENTVITSDLHLHKKYISLGLKSYLLPPNEIELPGYNTGFIGGTCGNIGKDEILFYGNFKKYLYYEDLKKILEKEKIDFYYPKTGSFIDRGSILGILGG